MKKKIIQKMNQAFFLGKSWHSTAREIRPIVPDSPSGHCQHHIIGVFCYFINTLSNSLLTESQISLAAGLSFSDTYTAS